MHHRTVSVPLAIGNLSSPLKSLALVRCLRCGVTLDWHQPDPGAPDRILGICVSCGRWHLMGMMPDEEGAVLVLLPDALQLQDTRGAS